MAKFVILYLLTLFLADDSFSLPTSQNLLQPQNRPKREGFLTMWESMLPPYHHGDGNFYGPLRRQIHPMINNADINNAVRSLLMYLEPLIPIMRRWMDLKDQFVPPYGHRLPPGLLGLCIKDLGEWVKNNTIKTTTDRSHGSTSETSVETDTATDSYVAISK